MSDARYRAAIIGLGFIGAGDDLAAERLGQQVSHLDGFHRQALTGHPRVDLIAGASRDAGRRERFEQLTGARTYTDWRGMLAREKLDIVSIASMTPDHAEQTISCAVAGVRAIYCEKPMAKTVVEAEAMITACERHGTRLVINHNRRFRTSFRRLRDVIAAGTLGRLISVNLRWASGRLGNVGTHFFDALRLLTGRDVVAVCAVLDPSAKPDCRGDEFRDPGGWALLRMEGGLMAVVNAPDHASDPAEISISGERGRAVVTGNEIELQFWDGRRERWPDSPAGPTSMDVAVEEIVSALDYGCLIASTGQDGLRALEVVLACHASASGGGIWVQLPLSGLDRERALQSG